jgi:hypothetical protein
VRSSLALGVRSSLALGVRSSLALGVPLLAILSALSDSL